MQIIKKYIAAYLSAPQMTLTEVNVPMKAIKVQNGSEESLFYLSELDKNTFFEEYGEQLFVHHYNASSNTFTTEEK